ncbi:MAG TPA: hypothetical protein VEA61_10320 [Allosphingosinicella sp.]|nr:hypothetical protein [Allosphingosinicella sp.]
MSKASTHRTLSRARAIAVTLVCGLSAWSAVPALAQEDMDRDDREFLQRAEREARAAIDPAALVAVTPLPINEYAVKVVCGRMGGPGQLTPVVNGFYATAVNVHNPGPLVTFWRKVAIARPGAPGPISGFKAMQLKNDQAVEFDCRQIFAQLLAAGIQPGPFVKGFLVIRSQRQLDVVAVYTAGPSNGSGASSIHTERVPPRRVP